MLTQFEEQVKSTEKSGFEKAILKVNEFSDLQIEPRQKLMDPWLKGGSIGLASGWRGVGKTNFALGILSAVTGGSTFGPWTCENPVTSMLLDGEMPVQDIMERSEEHGLTTDRKCPLYIYSDAYANYLGLSRANLADESWRGEMKDILLQKEVKFWVIDNLASLAAGLDENIKQDWDPINQWLLELRFAGISTLMLHHLGKAGLQRGTSAREDNLDYSILLKSPRNYMPEDGCRFIVNFSKARVRTSELSKIVDVEFKLVQDESGKLVWTWGTVKAEMKNEILKLLDEGMSQTDIKTTLGIDKGYVCRIRKQAIKDGLLTSKNKLTPTGFQVANES
jgi:putative DNA primase/helicase